jgi:hypothetical protein
LQYSLAAASLVGIEVPALSGILAERSDSELADARRLMEKIVALDGMPTTTSPNYACFAIRARRLTG